MGRGKSKKDKQEKEGKSPSKGKGDKEKDGKKKKRSGLAMFGNMMRSKARLHDNAGETKSTEKDSQPPPSPPQIDDDLLEADDTINDTLPPPNSPSANSRKKSSPKKNRLDEPKSPDGDPQQDDHMENSNAQLDAGPPIGEVVARFHSDAVSELPEGTTAGIDDVLDEDDIIHDPKDSDICFDDRNHPGTKEWIQVVRNSLDNFAETDYSPPVYKAIKKKLKGRRFLIRISRNSKTSWREATKPEVIELFGECFNEEKRRKREGILDDGSDIDESLQNSAGQSEASLSIGNLIDPPKHNNNNATSGDHHKNDANNHVNKRKKDNKHQHKANGNKDEDKHHNNISSSRQSSLELPKRSASHPAKMMGSSARLDDDGRAEEVLRMAISECEGAQEYAKPFDDVSKLQRGISAEQKLKTLLNLASAPHMTSLKKELDLLNDLAQRMRYASMAPLLETLENVERHMTEFFQVMAEHQAGASSSFLQHELRQSRSSDADFRSSQKAEAKPSKQSSQRSGLGSSGSGVDNGHSDDKVSSKNRSGKSKGRPKSTRNDFPPLSPHRAALGDSRLQNNSSFGDNGAEEGEESAAVHGNRSIPLMGSPGTSQHRKPKSSDEDKQDGDVGEATGGSVSSGDESPIGGEDEVQEKSARVDDPEDDNGSVEPELNEDDIDGARDDDSNSVEQDIHEESQNDSGYEQSENAQEENDEDEAEYVEEVAEDEIDNDAYDEEYADEGSEPVGDGDYEEEPVEAGLEGSQSLHEEDGQYDEEGASSGYLDNSAYLQGSAGYMQASQGLNGSNLDSPGGVDFENSHVLELGPTMDDVSSVGQSQLPTDAGSAHSSLQEGEEVTEVELDVDDFDDDEVIEDETSRYSDDSGGDNESEHNEEQGPPNPKMDAFMDRLKHFMEIRRKVDERASLTDPADKILGLKLKVHSGGIERKNGKFKKEYQQHDLKDKIVRSLDDLYEAGKKAEPELEKIAKQLVKDVKGMDDSCIIMGPMKTRDRALQKAREEYVDRKPGPAESWLYDIVRCSIVCKSYKQMSDVNKWLGKNAYIVKSKNRFETPAFNGYRDLLYHISVAYKGDLAHICEIQVHHKDIKALDDLYGLPKHMEFFRSAFAGPWRTQEETLEDLEMLNNYGAIGGRLMSKLMRSKNPQQLRLFAWICREKIDEFDRALELYRRMLILQEDQHGKNHESVAYTFKCIGLVLGEMGEADDSLMHLQKAVAIQESILGQDHLEVAESYSEIGHMLTKKGDYDGALKQYRTAMDIRESKLGSDHLMMVLSLQDIANAHTEKGDYKSAISELNKALDIQTAALGKEHNDVATSHELIGRTLCAQGEFKKATEELMLAFESREEHLGKNHPLTAESHTDIGIVLCQQGDYEIAEWRFRKALRILEAMRGKDHEDCAVAYTHLGGALSRKGDNEKALKEINKAVKIRENNLGRDHPLTANSYIDLGNVLCKMEDYEGALAEFRRAMVVHESILGQLHPDTADSYIAIGTALKLMGKHDAALAEHRRAVSIFEQVLGRNHPRTAKGYQCVADTLLAMGDKDEALIEHRKALAVRANVLAKDHPDTQASCTSIGGLLLDKGDLVGALVAYGQALAITVGLSGSEHPDTATAHINVGRVLEAQEDYSEALKSYKQAALIREAALGDQDLETADVYGMIGKTYHMLDYIDEAQEYHQKAAAIRAASTYEAPEVEDFSDPSEQSEDE